MSAARIPRCVAHLNRPSGDEPAAQNKRCADQCASAFLYPAMGSLEVVVFVTAVGADVFQLRELLLGRGRIAKRDVGFAEMLAGAAMARIELGVPAGNIRSPGSSGAAAYGHSQCSSGCRRCADCVARRISAPQSRHPSPGQTAPACRRRNRGRADATSASDVSSRPWCKSAILRTQVRRLPFCSGPPDSNPIAVCHGKMTVYTAAPADSAPRIADAASARIILICHPGDDQAVPGSAFLACYAAATSTSAHDHLIARCEIWPMLMSRGFRILNRQLVRRLPTAWRTAVHVLHFSLIRLWLRADRLIGLIRQNTDGPPERVA